ncbi:hypothetical protein [Xylophilus sp. Leaf220]|uniref:hypothetical protein n=1 Tax=Xylophilus sp. Leaf220 TaxID=1735686 RepID=UPI0012E31E06|nr:hypothetical protein [Xylophilus sp. Leaf220]
MLDMKKPTRTLKELQALLRERFEAIPELRGVRTDVEDGGIAWVDSSERGGANWTVRRVRPLDTYRADVARIIREAQAKYELDAEATEIPADW